ncbi:hypothetical protein A3731_00715 [Roseovarius sp. HI0049]|nr:hypothetical protein A3731_00715 [Roseovarius sp. HI0049]
MSYEEAAAEMAKAGLTDENCQIANDVKWRYFDMIVDRPAQSPAGLIEKIDAADAEIRRGNHEQGLRMLLSLRSDIMRANL